MKINVKIKLVFCLLSLMAVFSSCKKDFFDVPDSQGIDSQIWADEGAVELFLNRTYGLVIPQWPTIGGIHNTSDEMNSANTTLLYGQLVDNSITDLGTGNTITTNRYFDIRRCNIAIDGLNATEGLSEATKKVLKGQFFFLRAFTYFRMVNLYGGIPIVLKSQNLEEDDLNVPRSKTSECIQVIINDLDSAAAYLPASWPVTQAGKIPRSAASALKGKVLMYWASPQFNPSNISSRWQDAYVANKFAYNQCISDGFSLLGSYGSLFLTEDNKEILIARKYNLSKDFGLNLESVTRPSSESPGGSGSNQPTWNLVQAYTMNNGLPITNASSGYSPLMFWVNRDPRLDATIAYNGSVWPLSGKAGRKQWSYTGVPDETASSIVTGFYCKKLCNPSLTTAAATFNSNSGGGSGMDWIEMRLAEVMLNYAECANETNNLTEAKDMVRLIRQRAGIVAGTAPNDFGLVLGTDAATMRSIILNERQVEFAFEGKRFFDLRRTRNFAMLSNRIAYKLTPKSPYAAGTGTNPAITYLDKPNASGIKPRDTATLSNPFVYNAIFSSSVTSLEGSNVINLPNNYYFYPLPNFFSQNSFTIQQTVGWTNGTFDPLQ